MAITTNAADFTYASSEVLLTFYGPFTVSRLSHSHIQIEEDFSLSITAFGRGLPTEDAAGKLDFFCVIGPIDPPGAFEPVTLRASLISKDGSAVVCDGVPTSFKS